MEIVLALMLLGASPVGAAMLDKPTRNRFVNYLKVHNPLKKVEEEFVGILPRNKDWEPDQKLMVLWTEAFTYYQIPRREQKLKWALEKKASYDKAVAELAPKLGKAEAQLRELKRNGRYVSMIDTRAVREARESYDDMVHVYHTGLDKDDRFLIGLVDKYGTELFYNHDLIRLAAKPEEQFEVFDFAALTAYTSK